MLRQVPPLPWLERRRPALRQGPPLRRRLHPGVRTPRMEVVVRYLQQMRRRGVAVRDAVSVGAVAVVAAKARDAAATTDPETTQKRPLSLIQRAKHRRV